MIRSLMIAEMRKDIQYSRYCGRYGRYFYTKATGGTRADKKYNNKCILENRVNLSTLEYLEDAELLQAYRTYVRRWSAWM